MIRNGLLLENRYAELEREGHVPIEAIRLGSCERMVPILMTSLTTVLGLVPIVAALDVPGGEILVDTVKIDYDRERLAHEGLTLADAGEQVSAARSPSSSSREPRCRHYILPLATRMWYDMPCQRQKRRKRSEKSFFGAGWNCVPTGRCRG